MKFLLTFILVCCTGYVIFNQHVENKALTDELNSTKAELDSTNEKLVELQKKFDALQRVAAQRPAYPSTPGQPRNASPTAGTSQQTAPPAGPAPTPQSGAWMWDPNRVSPLGPSHSLGKGGAK